MIINAGAGLQMYAVQPDGTLLLEMRIFQAFPRPLEHLCFSNDVLIFATCSPIVGQRPLLKQEENQGDGLVVWTFKKKSLS
jgi:hypothetical protein